MPSDKKSNSMFLKEILSPSALKDNEEFPIPAVAVELYAEEVREDFTDEQYTRLLHKVITVGCKRIVTGQHDLTYVMNRLVALSNKHDGSPARATSRTFSSDFINFLNKLTTVQLLGLMTQFDVDAMRKLYCQLDIEDMLDLVNTYISCLMETGQREYEAALYGFGGKYEGDNGQAKQIDANSDQGMAALSAFGIGNLSLDALTNLTQKSSE